MADLTISASAVIAGANSRQKDGMAGATLAAGKAAYQKASDKLWYLADNNGTPAEAKIADGIALNGASAGQPVKVHLGGDLTVGSILTAGTAYYLSDTPGGICPLADVASGEDVCFIGLGKSATVLAVNIQAPGVTL